MFIATNIELEEQGFCTIWSPVANALNSVKEYFTQLGIDSEKRIQIKHNAGHPRCCKSVDSSCHLIYLSATDGLYCQWVYQFAHEYCHHLIDGELTGEPGGLMWLEEAVCHVSSLLCLNNYTKLCNRTNSPDWQKYAISVNEYLRNVLREGGDVNYDSFLPDENNVERYEMIPDCYFLDLHSFINENIIELTKTYNMDYHKKVSRALFPHFYNNPKLWEVLPLMGDMRQWNSLDELFDHLSKHAQDEYKESLNKMMSIIL